jgi:hypothetical protein
MTKGLRQLLLPLLISALLPGTRVLPATEELQSRQSDQAQQLQLRGEVTKIKLRSVDKGHVAFHVELKMELTNVGAEPIIILRREPWLGSEEISRSPEDAVNRKYLYVSGHWPSFYRAPGNEWEQLQHNLDMPLPPSDLTIILYHRGTWTFDTSTALYFEKDGSIRVYGPDGTYTQARQPWEVIRKAQPLWLQVGFEMWPLNVEPGLDSRHLYFGKKLQRRWRKDGKLWLEDLTSEPIKLDLKNFATGVTQ